MKRTFIILTFVLAALNVFSYDFEVDGIYYYIGSKEEMTCEVTESYQSLYSGDVNIPTEVKYNGNSYTVTSIGYGAFNKCIDLTSITIPNTVTWIAEYAFQGCSGLTTVTIPNSVIAIGEGAFHDCSGVTSLSIGNSVIAIYDWAFWDCRGLTSIKIPNSVSTIGCGAFSGCSLTSVMIPNSVESIGNGAFYDCICLKSVTIGKSVREIGNTAFHECSELKEIISLRTTPPRVGISAFEKVSKEECIVKVPVESVSAYSAAEEWKEFMNIMALTDEEMEVLGISSVVEETNINPVKTYNLSGQPVGKSDKGIVIQNGKKIINK